MSREANDLATPAEAAEYLRTTVAGLRQMRYLGTGPVFARIGRQRVVYKWADLYAYVDASRRVSTGETSE